MTSKKLIWIIKDEFYDRIIYSQHKETFWSEGINIGNFKFFFKLCPNGINSQTLHYSHLYLYCYESKLTNISKFDVNFSTRIREIFLRTNKNGTFDFNKENHLDFYSCWKDNDTKRDRLTVSKNNQLTIETTISISNIIDSNNNSIPSNQWNQYLNGNNPGKV